MAKLRGAGAALLGVWLILHGLASIIGLSFHGMHLILGILALIAGILLLLDR